jgi:hypothetical protein
MVLNATTHLPAVATRRSPIFAAFLSVFLPGLGQLYCCQDNKGIFLIGVFLLAHWSTGGLSSWILCPAMAGDALLIARSFNDGKIIRRWEFFSGIRTLNPLPPRIMLLAIVMLVAALTVVHILLFAADYPAPDK